MKIVGMYDYLLFDDNQERRRQFRAKANSNRRKLQQETRKVVEAFYADKANWPLIIAAKARDGGKHGRGDMDSELWAALFVAFFGTPANGIGDLRWDEIFDVQERCAISMVSNAQQKFWSKRARTKRLWWYVTSYSRSALQTCVQHYKHVRYKKAVP
jgi:hypothetical protein